MKYLLIIPFLCASIISNAQFEFDANTIKMLAFSDPFLGKGEDTDRWKKDDFYFSLDVKDALPHGRFLIRNQTDSIMVARFSKGKLNGPLFKLEHGKLSYVEFYYMDSLYETFTPSDNQESDIKVLDYQSVKHPNEPYFKILQAQILFKLGHADSSIQVLERLIESGVSNESIYYHLGLFYALKLDVDKAIIYFNKATEIDPKLCIAYQNLSIIYRDSGDVNHSKQYLMKSYECNPSLDSFFELKK